MLNNNLEQIIDQCPDHKFSFIYPTGVEGSLWHDSYLWHGRVTDTNNSNRHIMQPCDAPTFQAVSDALVLHGLTDQSKQQLLDAAKNSLQTSIHEPMPGA